MATKKQKRAAMAAKHEKFMTETRERGLQFLKKDQARRVELKRQNAEKAKKAQQRASTTDAMLKLAGHGNLVPNNKENA